MYAQGCLFFLREQTLMAQPFDVERLELTGNAVPIAEHVSVGGQTGTAGGLYSLPVGRARLSDRSGGSGRCGGNVDTARLV